MKNFNILACAAALALAAGMPAFASDLSDILPEGGDDLSVHKEVGDWTVYSDATRGSCLIQRSDAEGNIMQMGLTKDQSAMYVGVFTQATIPVEPDQPIEIVVDGEIFVGESQGVRTTTLAGGDYFGGYVLSDDLDFVEAIAKGRNLVAFPEKTGLFVIDLTGTKRAIDEARACNKSLGS